MTRGWCYHFHYSVQPKRNSDHILSTNYLFLAQTPYTNLIHIDTFLIYLIYSLGEALAQISKWSKKWWNAFFWALSKNLTSYVTKLTTFENSGILALLGGLIPPIQILDLGPNFTKVSKIHICRVVTPIPDTFKGDPPDSNVSSTQSEFDETSL